MASRRLGAPNFDESSRAMGESCHADRERIDCRIETVARGPEKAKHLRCLGCFEQRIEGNHHRWERRNNFLFLHASFLVAVSALSFTKTHKQVRRSRSKHRSEGVQWGSESRSGAAGESETHQKAKAATFFFPFLFLSTQVNEQQEFFLFSLSSPLHRLSPSSSFRPPRLRCPPLSPGLSLSLSGPFSLSPFPHSNWQKTQKT